MVSNKIKLRLYSKITRVVSLSAITLYSTKELSIIDIKYHVVRERVASGEIELKYVATEHQLADLLTKGLAGPRTVMLRNRIMGCNQ